MPFEMECTLVVAQKYWASSTETRRAFDEALDRIAADWTGGSPDLRSSRYPLQLRRHVFSEGVLVFRYAYDDDITPKVEVLAWEPTR